MNFKDEDKNTEEEQKDIVSELNEKGNKYLQKPAQ